MENKLLNEPGLPSPTKRSQVKPIRTVPHHVRPVVAGMKTGTWKYENPTWDVSKGQCQWDGLEPHGWGGGSTPQPGPQ
jgi:hypothetical protein